MLLATLRINDQLLDASRNEPSGGPGWREGLGMLAQFGRSLFDALVALELAVKDSQDDGYAEQLEPALGKLVHDIHTGFHYVAGCIHKWRFHVPPPGLHLEDDIAQLEERMSALRPKGIAVFAGRNSARVCGAAASETDCPPVARVACGDEPGRGRGATSGFCAGVV